MKNIGHLPAEERQHYERCPVCGHYIDLRDLNDVAFHMHDNLPVMHYSSATRFRNAEEWPNTTIWSEK
jgi:hypothetical protein